MKERLDVLLVQRGLAESREKAKTIIMSGDVFVKGNREDKAGSMFDVDAEITVKGNTLKYVSRGGLKLEKAMEVYPIDLKGKVCMDIGSSTGGFTDCMLQNGARKVYSVDVGYGQLAWKLRTDERVKVVERVNVKICFDYEIYDPNDERPDFCAADLSFISVTKVLENLRTLMIPDNIQIVTLIKPQFEAGKEEVGKNGVVKDKNIHIKVISKVINYAQELGLTAINLTESPIKGPAGNIEYLLLLSDKGEKEAFDVEKIVGEAFEKLN